MNKEILRQIVEKACNDALTSGELSPADICGTLEWIKLSLAYAASLQIMKKNKVKKFF